MTRPVPSSLAVAVALVAAVVPACGGRTTPAPTRAAGPEAPPPAAAVPATKPTAPACTLEPSHALQRIEIGDDVREYVRVVGDQVAAPAPLLFVWHGFGSNPEQMLAAVEPELWRDAILVAPQGLGRTFEQFGETERPGFQVHTGELGDRDLRLFDAILEDLLATGCVDPSRVYTTGFSNGGFFSNVLACHRAGQIAAAAAVGGGGPFVHTCGPAVPVHVTHGRADRVVPFDSAEATWSFWLEHAGCSEPTPLPEDGCVDVGACGETDLAACVFAGGHVWPPEQPARIREFLARHAKPAEG